MVNTSLNWVSIVGIVLMIGGALLFSLRSYKPALSRDTDVFFAAVGLLCGGILFFQGWRLDPILQFSQFLLATTTVFFVYESVRLRGVTAEQARRSEFMDDPAENEPRPRVAPIGSGLDEWDTLEQRPPMRRRALAAADWDQPTSRRPIRRAPEEEPPEWGDSPPLPARQNFDRDVQQAPGGRRSTRPGRDPSRDPSRDPGRDPSRDPMGTPSLRPQRPERSQDRGRSPRVQLEPSEERFQPRDQPRDQRPAPRPQRDSRPRAGRADGYSERPLVARNQRRPAVRSEPFDQDPDLKLARSVPHASLPPQGKPLNRNQRTAPPSSGVARDAVRDDTALAAREPKPRLDAERDNSSRFDH